MGSNSTQQGLRLMDAIARFLRQPGAILVLAAVALVAGGTAGAIGLPGEVSGPGSLQPFVLEPFSPFLPGPCDQDPVGIRGCSCCRWADGAESGSDSFNLFRMGDLAQLTGGYQFVCAQAGLVSPLTICCEEFLFRGQAAGYLVQGENLSGTGILGRSSTGAVIPAALACP